MTSSLSLPPFMGFAADESDALALKAFAAKQGWNEACIHAGALEDAANFLTKHPSPRVLCVEIASANQAAASLDRLADVCDPGIKVIIYGAINEFSFYRSLLDMGIADYLLKPLTTDSLSAAYAKATAVSPVAGPAAPAPEAKAEGKVIAVIGSRGGAGATTVAVNLAWILAHRLHKKTALLDFDPQLGTVALTLDLEPSKGLRDALEKPERIDGLFLDRVMVRLDEEFSILSTEEPIEDQIAASEKAAEALLRQTRPKFSHIVVDVPRHLTPFTRYALKHADHVVCVTELSVAGLRESLRYLDYCRDVLKVTPPLFVANRVGVAGKYNMPPQEFEKGLGHEKSLTGEKGAGVKLSANIAYAQEAYKATITGELLAEAAPNAPATRALNALAARFVPEDAGATPKKGKSLFGAMKKGK